jgi:hypothetical protein
MLLFLVRHTPAVPLQVREHVFSLASLRRKTPPQPTIKVRTDAPRLPPFQLPAGTDNSSVSGQNFHQRLKVLLRCHLERWFFRTLCAIGEQRIPSFVQARYQRAPILCNWPAESAWQRSITQRKWDGVSVVTQLQREKNPQNIQTTRRHTSSESSRQ